MDWRLLVPELSLLLAYHFRVFAVSWIFWVLKYSLVFGSLRTSLLCIMGELAWGGSLAVAERFFCPMIGFFGKLLDLKSCVSMKIHPAETEGPT